MIFNVVHIVQLTILSNGVSIIHSECSAQNTMPANATYITQSCRFTGDRYFQSLLLPLFSTLVAVCFRYRYCYPFTCISYYDHIDLLSQFVSTLCSSFLICSCIRGYYITKLPRYCSSGVCNDKTPEFDFQAKIVKWVFPICNIPHTHTRHMSVVTFVTVLQHESRAIVAFVRNVPFTFPVQAT